MQLKQLKNTSFILALSVSALNLSGCMSYGRQDIVYNEQNQSHARNALAAKTYTSANQLEEYVSRIGKRLVIVSDSPMQNVAFRVNNTPKKELYKQKNTIYISKGFLKSLDDEAELAAALSVMLNTKNDRNRMLNLSRAGYDPKAFVDLKHKSKNDSELGVFFGNDELADNVILENNKLLPKLPQGLQRQGERYKNSVGI